MNFYKKIFRSRKLRFRILSMLRFIPDEPMLKLQYWIKCGRPLNLKDPKRYTEKIQCYKLYYRDPVMQQCADKYQVREYVKSKGLGHILNELYAVYESPEEIDLEKLPEKFVLKLSNGSNTNLLCKDKSTLDPGNGKADVPGFPAPERRLRRPGMGLSGQQAGDCCGRTAGGSGTGRWLYMRL